MGNVVHASFEKLGEKKSAANESTLFDHDTNDVNNHVDISEDTSHNDDENATSDIHKCHVTLNSENMTNNNSAAAHNEQLKKRDDQRPPYPPFFLTELNNTTVMEGENVRLECRVISERGLTITWFKNGDVVRDQFDGCLIEADDCGWNRLTVLDAR